MLDHVHFLRFYHICKECFQRLFLHFALLCVASVVHVCQVAKPLHNIINKCIS